MKELQCFAVRLVVVLVILLTLNRIMSGVRSIACFEMFFELTAVCRWADSHIPTKQAAPSLDLFHVVDGSKSVYTTICNKYVKTTFILLTRCG